MATILDGSTRSDLNALIYAAQYQYFQTTPSQHTLSIHILNTHSQHTLPTHAPNTRSKHTLQIHAPDSKQFAVRLTHEYRIKILELAQNIVASTESLRWQLKHQIASASVLRESRPNFTTLARVNW